MNPDIPGNSSSISSQSTYCHYHSPVSDLLEVVEHRGSPSHFPVVSLETSIKIPLVPGTSPVRVGCSVWGIRGPHLLVPEF